MLFILQNRKTTAVFQNIIFDGKTKIDIKTSKRSGNLLNNHLTVIVLISLKDEIYTIYILP